MAPLTPQGIRTLRQVRQVGRAYLPLTGDTSVYAGLLPVLAVKGGAGAQVQVGIVRISHPVSAVADVRYRISRAAERRTPCFGARPAEQLPAQALLEVTRSRRAPVTPIAESVRSLMCFRPAGDDG